MVELLSINFHALIGTAFMTKWHIYHSSTPSLAFQQLCTRWACPIDDLWLRIYSI